MHPWKKNQQVLFYPFSEQFEIWVWKRLIRSNYRFHPIRAHTFLSYHPIWAAICPFTRQIRDFGKGAPIFFSPTLKMQNCLQFKIRFSQFFFSTFSYFFLSNLFLNISSLIWHGHLDAPPSPSEYASGPNLLNLGPFFPKRFFLIPTIFFFLKYFFFSLIWGGHSPPPWYASGPAL